MFKQNSDIFSQSFNQSSVIFRVA